MNISPMLIVFEVLCFALLYTTFCRLVKLTNDALRIARAAYTALGGAVIVCMYLAMFRGYTPSGPDCLLLASFALVQIVSSRGWKERYPAHLSSRPVPLTEEKSDEPSHNSA